MSKKIEKKEWKKHFRNQLKGSNWNGVDGKKETKERRKRKKLRKL